MTDEAPGAVRRVAAPSWLRSTWAQIVFVVAAGAVAFSPNLRAQFWMDDCVQRSMLHGTFPVHRSILDLYNFVNDSDRAVLIQRGVVPWWTDPHLTIRFFRPLSSLLRWLDFRVFGDVPLFDHLHSLAWWAAIVVGLHALYRRSLSPRAAFIATFVFALSPCHVVPLGWLANREVLVSLAFGAFGLNAYTRFRDGGGLADGLAAAVLFALAMLGSEYGLVFGGYVLAMEIWRTGGLWQRAARVLPFAVPALTTLVTRRVLGFGNSGSGFYRDPIHQTRIFAEGVPRRMARMLLDSWLASESDWVNDAHGLVLAAFLVVVGALLLMTVRRALAEQPEQRRRVAKAWLLGALITLLPMTSVAPAARLVGISMIGVAPVVALVLEQAWFDDRSALATGLPSLVALMLGFFHLVHGPVTSYLSARFFLENTRDFTERAEGLHQRIGDASHAKVVMARAGWQTVLFAPFAVEPDNALPERWWLLSLAPHALLLRTGERTVDLVVPRGKGYFPTGPDDIFRSQDHPLPVGYEVTVPGMHVKILSVGDKTPARIRFDFDQKLESLVWVSDGAEAFVDATPPEIGFGRPLGP